MKKLLFIFIISILLISTLSAQAESKGFLTDNTNELFNSVEGVALSPTEMEKEKVGITFIAAVGAFLTIYGGAATVYGWCTGRNYTKDIHRHATRMYRKTSTALHRAQDKNWRKRTYGSSW